MLLEKKDGKSSTHWSPPTPLTSKRLALPGSLPRTRCNSNPAASTLEPLSSPRGVDTEGPGAAPPSASARVRGQPPLSPAGRGATGTDMRQLRGASHSPPGGARWKRASPVSWTSPPSKRLSPEGSGWMAQTPGTHTKPADCERPRQTKRSLLKDTGRGLEPLGCSSGWTPSSTAAPRVRGGAPS